MTSGSSSSSSSSSLTSVYGAWERKRRQKVEYFRSTCSLSLSIYLRGDEWKKKKNFIIFCFEKELKAGPPFWPELIGSSVTNKTLPRGGPHFSSCWLAKNGRANSTNFLFFMRSKLDRQHFNQGINKWLNFELDSKSEYERVRVAFFVLIAFDQKIQSIDRMGWYRRVTEAKRSSRMQISSYGVSSVRWRLRA